MTEPLYWCYQDYVQAIKSYCDAIVAPLGSSWRNRYYAICIANLEFIHLENRSTMALDRDDNIYTPSDGGRFQHQDPHVGLDPRTPTSAVSIASSGSSGTSKSSGSIDTSSTLPPLDSPASSVSSENQTSHHASPTSFKSSVTTNPCPALAHSQSSTISNNSISLTYNLSSISSTSTSPGTAVAPSPAASNHSMATSPQDNKAYCEWCPKSFSGTRQHRESNRKRHMNDTHQLGPRLSCFESGCEYKCGRTDNLRNHCLKVHGHEDPSVRSGNPKRPWKSRRTRTVGTPPASTQPRTHEPSLR